MIPMQALTYWQIVLIIILLVSPLTWVMNTIWLLPSIAISIYWYSLLTERRQAFFLALGVAALLLAAIPDQANYLFIIPYGVRFIYLKYVVAELLLMVSLMYFMTMNVSQEKTDDSHGVPPALHE